MGAATTFMTVFEHLDEHTKRTIIHGYGQFFPNARPLSVQLKTPGTARGRNDDGRA